MKERNLKGKKVFLRLPKFEDFSEFASRALASRRFHRNLVNPPADRESFSEYVSKNERAENACFLICRLEDEKIAGGVNLSQIFRGAFQNAYLGYYLFAGFTGEGLMSEAIRLISRHAFETLKLHRLEANVQPQNKESIAVLERAGFTKEGFSRRYLKIGGRWRDHERWALVAEDWKRNKHGKQGS